MNEIIQYQLEQKIRDCIQDASGGLKLLELIPKIRTNPLLRDVTSDEIETTILGMTDLEILHYTYKALNREKLFIYTP